MGETVAGELGISDFEKDREELVLGALHFLRGRAERPIISPAAAEVVEPSVELTNSQKLAGKLATKEGFIDTV